MCRNDDPIKSRTILEEGLKAYPDNYILLNNLLYVIDYQSEPDEVIKIANKLIYSSLQFLDLRFNIAALETT